MTFGQRLALNLTPLLLRLGLAFVFIYYGASKLFYADLLVQGEEAAYLANAGLIKAPPRPALPPPSEAPAPAKEKGEAAFRAEPPPSYLIILAQNTQKPAGEEPKTDAQPAEKAPEAEPPASEKPEPAPTEKKRGTGSPPKYSAADFAEPVKVRRLLGVVLTMHGAAENHDWPRQLSSPTVLMILAWAAALTEFLGGWLILLGFLTRIWALCFVATMCAAMWLSQIAPNIGAEHALFGFLPPLQIASAENWGSWMTWHFQAILLVSSLGVVLSGPGKASLDAMLFKRPDRTEGPRPPQDHA